MSSSASTTTPRGSTFKRCLVIENQNQATPSTCCYPNSLKNRTASTESSKKFNLTSQVQYKLTKNCENQTKGALVDDNNCKNGERSSGVRENFFCENVNRNENSYTSLLLLSPSSSSPSSSSFQRENSLIHSSCGIRSINSVIDSSNAIFKQHSCNPINCDPWNQQNICNLNSTDIYSVNSTCNDSDLIQSKQDNNVNDVWNVDSVGVSKLRTPSNLCKSNRQVPIIRKLTPKVSTKILNLNEGLECNVIGEQQHKTKIAQLSVIKRSDNVKSNDDIDDNDSHFTLVDTNLTADVSCLSSTLHHDNVIVCCDDHDRTNASECLVKNAENRCVFVEKGCVNANRFPEQNPKSKYSWNEPNNQSDEFVEHSVRNGVNSDGVVKEHYYRSQYKKISPQGNRRFANSTGTTSLVLLGSSRQYSGIYVSFCSTVFEIFYNFLIFTKNVRQ